LAGTNAIPGKAPLIAEPPALPVNLLSPSANAEAIGPATSLRIDPRRPSSQVNRLSSRVNARLSH
jgi:hypothetical protein